MLSKSLWASLGFGSGETALWSAFSLCAGVGVTVWVTAMVCGFALTQFWKKSVGAIASSARRIAEGDQSVSFGEFDKIVEVRHLARELERLVEVRERQGRELREMLRHFHGTFENSAVGVFHVNRDGFLRRVNQRVCEIFGYEREDLLQRGMQEILHFDDAARLIDRLTSVFHGVSESFCSEFRGLHRLDRVVWLRITVTLMRSDDGVAEYGIGFVEDVSAQRRMEEKLLRSEASLRGLMECNRDSCVAILDLNGNVVSVNPIGAELLGKSDGDFAPGSSWGGLWQLGEDGEFERALYTANCGGVGRFRGQRNKGKEGEAWWEVTMTAIPGLDGRLERLLSVARDVTLQHLAAVTLEKAKESAEAASRAKDDFMSALSHELRTPLSPVLLLSGEYARSMEVSSRMREDFALIHRNVRLEARLIDDLLDLTRIQRGGLSMSARLLDLGSILSQMCETVRTEATEKRVRVNFERPSGVCYVRGDGTRLHQIFTNLVLNAVKFSNDGGTVRVGVVETDGVVRVSVGDDGIGITPEENGRIFEPFAQGAHAIEPHRFGGLGLGLAIAKMLVERHRGRIWAESNGRGCGALFYVELPAEESVSEALVPAESVDTGKLKARARKILLVEDHEPTRLTLARMLGRRGHEVTQVGTYQAAVDCAKGGVFDVLISDIGLPDGNGGELIREYGGHFLEGGIALSGFGMDVEVRRSLQAGFRKHLTKPIELELLEQTLNSLEAEQSQVLSAV